MVTKMRYATSRTVTGSIPDEVIGFFFSVYLIVAVSWVNSTSIRNEYQKVSWVNSTSIRNEYQKCSRGKGRPAHKADSLTPITEQIVCKTSFNVMGLYGVLQGYRGVATASVLIMV
jgi:hypothetical protein